MKKKSSKLKSTLNNSKKIKNLQGKKLKSVRANKSLVKQQVSRSPARSNMRRPKKNLSQSVNNSSVKHAKKSIKLRFLKG